MMSYPNEKAQPPSYSSLQHHQQGGPATTTTTTSRICCINLHHYDKIRLVGVPPELVEAVKSQIVASSGVAIQKEAIAYNVPELKMHGYPWIGSGSDSVKSRRIVLGIFRAMIVHGWELLAASDVVMKQGTMDSLFFEEVQLKPGQVDKPPLDMWALVLKNSDKIRLIDAPVNMQEVVRNAIVTQWAGGITREEVYEGSYEFKLKGNPMMCSGEEHVRAQMLFAQMLASIRAAGYKLYTSLSMTCGNGEYEVETWIFRRVASDWP